VIIIDADEVEAEGGVAGRCPSGVAGQDIDLTGLQSRKAILGREGHELDLLGIVEHRRCDRLAEVDVETAPFPLRVGKAEAGKRAVAAAVEHSAILYRFQCLSGCALHNGGEQQCKYRCKSLHLTVPSTRIGGTAFFGMPKISWPDLHPAAITIGF